MGLIYFLSLWIVVGIAFYSWVMWYDRKHNYDW